MPLAGVSLSIKRYECINLCCVCSTERVLLDIYSTPMLTIQLTDLIRILSTCGPISLVPLFSRPSIGGACHFRSLYSVFERRWVLIRGWGHDQRGRRGGERSDGGFFICPRSFRPFSGGLSSAIHDPCVQHRGEEEQEDGAYAHANDNPSVPAVGSISILDRGPVMLSQGEPSSASEA